MFPNERNLKTWLKKQSLTTGDYLGWRIASILIVGLMLGSAVFSIWFIYYNIYVTIANTASIVILQSSQKADTIDWNSFEQAQKNLLLKSDKTEWPKNIRDIFNYADIATTTTSTSAKTKYEKK